MRLTDGGGGASGRALATSWLPRLLRELPLGSPVVDIRPQTLAHRSIHPLTQPAYTSVDVLKLKNNYKATATVYLKVCGRKKRGRYYENCLFVCCC